MSKKIWTRFGIIIVCFLGVVSFFIAIQKGWINIDIGADTKNNTEQEKQQLIGKELSDIIAQSIVIQKDTDGDGDPDIVLIDANNDGVFEKKLEDDVNDGSGDDMHVLDGDDIIYKDTDHDGDWDIKIDIDGNVFLDLNENGVWETTIDDMDDNGKIDIVATDTNENGTFDQVMVDANNDGIPEIMSDKDEDGDFEYGGVEFNESEADFDGDGVFGEKDECPFIYGESENGCSWDAQNDEDNDGSSDATDNDDDGDGILDENDLDDNNNGVPDTEEIDKIGDINSSWGLPDLTGFQSEPNEPVMNDAN